MTTDRRSDAITPPAFLGVPWSWVGAMWLAFALIDATQTVLVMHAQGMHHPWARLFAFRVVVWSLWMLASPLMLALDHRFPMRRGRLLAPALAHLCLCAPMALAVAAWSLWLEAAMDPYGTDAMPAPLASQWFEGFLESVAPCLIVYATALAIGYGLRARERLIAERAESARLSEQLAKAQLDALRRQLEPHFLFNALNAIAGLVRERRHDDAIGTIAGFGDLLRRVLDDSTGAEVPLREELDFLRVYLDIQKLRFGDRLHVGIDVPDELLTARVPRLILQPLAENAFKHGLSKRAQGGALRVSASGQNGLLTLRVYNDGPAAAAHAAPPRPGIGLSNTVERLRSLYGERCDLRLERREGGTEAIVLVPLEVD
ncbi:sensor histidine kinase [Dyella acidisoli]|nr:histidine kinase [Dyella acidisoli]